MRDARVSSRFHDHWHLRPGIVAHRLAAECCSPTVHFGLRDRTSSDQSSDAGMGQTVTVAAHAILQTSGLEAPLAAEPAIIFGTFSLTGLGRSGRAENDTNNDQQHPAIVLHPFLPE
jgi:hypothetical protein